MTDYEYILAQCGKEDSEAWTDESVKAIKAVPTVKLAEIMYRNIESYEWNLARMDWAEFSHFYKDVYENARDELRERYVSGVDRKVIESAFNHSSSENREWLKWQRRMEKTAVERYKNPLLEGIRSCEVFADKEFVEGKNPLALSFDLVIRIKDNRHFFHHGDGRLDAVMELFIEKSVFSIQYVGIGKDIWLGVADEKSIGIDDDEYLSKMDSIIEARQRRLESGCQAIEALAKQIDKESSVSASICKKEVLLGKFLMEICDYEKYDDSKSFTCDI